METFRKLLVGELKKQNYPIAKTKIGTTHKIYQSKVTLEEGIEIIRTCYKIYVGKSDKVEVIEIYKNNFIEDDKLNEIIETIKANYNARLYNPDIKKLEIYVY